MSSLKIFCRQSRVSLPLHTYKNTKAVSTEDIHLVTISIPVPTHMAGREAVGIHCQDSLFNHASGTCLYLNKGHDDFINMIWNLDY